MRLIRFMWRELLYNGHLQSLGAVGIVLFSSMVLNLRLPIMAYVMVYLLFETIYLFDRYRDFHYDISTNKDRSEHIRPYLGKLPIVITALSLLQIFYSLYFGLPLFVYTLSIVVGGIMYPTFIKKLTKYVPLLKNIYVSLFHSLLLIYPIVYFKLPINLSDMFVAIFAYVFFETMLMQMILDTKDTTSDKAVGLKTLAVLLGNKKAIVATICLSIVNAIIFFIIYKTIGLPNYFVYITIISVATNVIMSGYALTENKVAYLISGSKFFHWLCVLSGIIISM